METVGKGKTDRRVDRGVKGMEVTSSLLPCSASDQAMLCDAFDCSTQLNLTGAAALYSAALPNASDTFVSSTTNLHIKHISYQDCLLKPLGSLAYRPSANSTVRMMSQPRLQHIGQTTVKMMFHSFSAVAAHYVIYNLTSTMHQQMQLVPPALAENASHRSKLNIRK
jgi:hypothetical protein